MEQSNEKELIILAFYINNTNSPIDHELLIIHLTDIINDLNNNSKYEFKIIPLYTDRKTEIKCIFPYIPTDNDYKKDLKLLDKHLLELKKEYQNNEDVTKLIRMLKMKSMDFKNI